MTHGRKPRIHQLGIDAIAEAVPAILGSSRGLGHIGVYVRRVDALMDGSTDAEKSTALAVLRTIWSEPRCSNAARITAFNTICRHFPDAANGPSVSRDPRPITLVVSLGGSTEATVIEPGQGDLARLVASNSSRIASAVFTDMKDIQDRLETGKWNISRIASGPYAECTQRAMHRLIVGVTSLKDALKIVRALESGRRGIADILLPHLDEEEMMMLIPAVMEEFEKRYAARMETLSKEFETKERDNGKTIGGFLRTRYPTYGDDFLALMREFGLGEMPRTDTTDNAAHIRNAFWLGMAMIVAISTRWSTGVWETLTEVHLKTLRDMITTCGSALVTPESSQKTDPYRAALEWYSNAYGRRNQRPISWRQAISLIAAEHPWMTILFPDDIVDVSAVLSRRKRLSWVGGQ